MLPSVPCVGEDTGRERRVRPEIGDQGRDLAGGFIGTRRARRLWSSSRPHRFWFGYSWGWLADWCPVVVAGTAPRSCCRRRAPSCGRWGSSRWAGWCPVAMSRCWPLDWASIRVTRCAPPDTVCPLWSECWRWCCRPDSVPAKWCWRCRSAARCPGPAVLTVVALSRFLVTGADAAAAICASAYAAGRARRERGAGRYTGHRRASRIAAVS